MTESGKKTESRCFTGAARRRCCRSMWQEQRCTTGKSEDFDTSVLPCHTARIDVHRDVSVPSDPSDMSPPGHFSTPPLVSSGSPLSMEKQSSPVKCLYIRTGRKTGDISRKYSQISRTIVQEASVDNFLQCRSGAKCWTAINIG